MKDRDSLILENLYLQLLLEKDHRQKIISMGLPEDVANFLHNFNNKYSIWFADKIKDMNGFQWAGNKLNWINVNLLTQMQGIMDWIRNVQNINLKQYSWDQAVEAQEEYHENLKSATLEGAEDNRIIKKYNDGMYWVDLETRSCEEERQLMGHCASTSKGDTLFSLRKYTPETNEKEAFVTISLSPSDGVWYQCKGKKNSKPKDEYFRYIADILIDNDIFVFKGEYDSPRDFTNMDLERYVRTNAAQIPNSEEILQKIDEQNINEKDFEKAIKEYDFKNLYIELDLYSGDEENIMSVYYAFSMELKYSEVDIPNIEELVEEHEGEFYKKEDVEFLEELLEKYDIYPEEGTEIRIGTSNDGNGFYISAYLSSDDRYFNIDEDGLHAFRRQCQYIQTEGESLEKRREEFIEDFKIFALKDGWYSIPYTDFIDGVESEREEANLLNVGDVQTNKDFDFTIKFKAIKNPLEKFEDYEKSIMDNLGTIDYLNHRDLNKQERDRFPFAQYMLDYFKFVFNDYLNIPEFTVRGLSNKNTPRGQPPLWEISIQDTLRFEDREKYNYDKEIQTYKKINTYYDDIVKKFNKFFDEVISPNIEASRELTANDVYYKTDELKDLFKKEGNEYSHVEVPLYDKITNKEIGNVFYWMSDYLRQNNDAELDKSVKEKINKLFSEKNLRIYPPYDKKAVRNFFKNNFEKQLTFKQFMEEK